jgi:hypothetical protein
MFDAEDAGRQSAVIAASRVNEVVLRGRYKIRSNAFVVQCPRNRIVSVELLGWAVLPEIDVSVDEVLGRCIIEQLTIV